MCSLRTLGRIVLLALLAGAPSLSRSMHGDQVFTLLSAELRGRGANDEGEASAFGLNSPRFCTPDELVHLELHAHIQPTRQNPVRQFDECDRIVNRTQQY